MSLCAKCEKPKELTRAKSKLCRACDGASRAKRAGRAVTQHRRLTLELPVEVWDRLDAEAQENGQRIAGYLRDLTVKRDTRQLAKKHGATP